MKVILLNYKRITKIYNQKVSAFNENGDIYLGLNFDAEINDGTLINCNIHKISLSDFNIDISDKRNCKLVLNLVPVKNEIMKLTNITSVK